jgi:hypothetical protein
LFALRTFGCHSLRALVRCLRCDCLLLLLLLGLLRSLCYRLLASSILLSAPLFLFKLSHLASRALVPVRCLTCKGGNLLLPLLIDWCVGLSHGASAPLLRRAGLCLLLLGHLLAQVFELQLLLSPLFRNLLNLECLC